MAQSSNFYDNVQDNYKPYGKIEPEWHEKYCSRVELPFFPIGRVPSAESRELTISFLVYFSDRLHFMPSPLKHDQAKDAIEAEWDQYE